ncbi:MAG: hypothetical protein U0324_23400 [Polyangiales bacterium]
MKLALPLGLAFAGCAERCEPYAPDGATYHPQAAEPVENVDLLVSMDNSGSMDANQRALSAAFGPFLDSLINPPFNPQTMRPRTAPVKSLHVGVVSSDLGTPGSVVPSCAHSDQGDDGLLNPVRRGLATRAHPPWTTAPPGARPARCANDPDQFPSFLSFDRTTSDPPTFAEEFACNAYLSQGGCGLEQQLESVYRALVIHDPRMVAGNTDPNAGFVRDNAVLAILVVSDEEDGSVRDCRYAERGAPCTDAISVFDISSPQWSSDDLNLRLYNYVPGSAQDPTWPIDRYIDPARPNRGFLSLKPGRPELVVFGAIAGVPLALPSRADGGVDWDALLGRNPDGSDGYVGMSAEGPVSMRQRNLDPACSTRVVPACRREGSTAATTCDPAAQYFAWPSRRIAQVARRFDALRGNAALGSICRNDFTGALARFAERIQRRIGGRCLARPVATVAAPCEPGSGQQGCARTYCVLREVLPADLPPSTACTAARGRSPGPRDESVRRDTCVVREVALPPGGAPPTGREGFYYDTRTDPTNPGCDGSFMFTPGALLVAGSTAYLDCPIDVPAAASPTCR